MCFSAVTGDLDECSRTEEKIPVYCICVPYPLPLQIKLTEHPKGQGVVFVTYVEQIYGSHLEGCIE